MLNPIDTYFLKQKEPNQSYMLSLRQLLLEQHTDITEAWKYGMPFYCYKGKMFCYLWTVKKTGQPYLGIVEGNKLEHPLLLQDKRARMKIMLFDVVEDVPVTVINEILAAAKALYK